MAPSNPKSLDSQRKDKSTKSKKVSKKPPVPVAYKSEEFVQESDEETNENGQPADEDPTEESDSDELSSSVKPAKSSSKTNGKLPAPAGSSSSSEGSSDGSSEAEEDSENSVHKAPVIIDSTNQPATQPITNTVSSKAPPPYRPPPGFDAASIDGVSKASQMLNFSSLAGKQIWYFTAPTSVPISSLKSMSMLDAKDGKTVLTHEGNDYCFMKDCTEDTTYTKIMLPSSDAGYKASSKSIDQAFHLQQVAQDPTTANHTRATIPARKPVRQQPRGLKMRFHPIGFGAAEPGTIGSSSSDEDMEDAPFTTYRPVSKRKSAAKSSGEPHESDEEMVDSPALHSRPHPEVISKREKKQKRKHSEAGGNKSKHSSYSVMKSNGHGELKRSKKKQTESRRKLADSPSVSTEDQENMEPPPPLRIKAPSKHSFSTTPIPPPKPLTFSQSSAANTGLHHSKSSSKKSKSTEEPHSSPIPPPSGGQMSLQQMT